MRIPRLSEMESFAARDGIFLDRLLFSACLRVSEEEEVKEEARGPRKEAMVKMVRFLMGSVHQGCECFQPFNGVQCTPIALMALL